MGKGGISYPYAVIGSIAIILIAAIIGAHHGLSDLRFVNESLHSTFEAIGALSAILMANILLQKKNEKSAGSYLPIGMGFLAMGLMDTVHAMLPSSSYNIFIWSRSTASLAGGLFFALIWLPAARKAKWRKLLLGSVIAGVALLCLWITVAEQTVPGMLANGNFSVTALALNATAGVLFTVSAVRCFIDSRRFESAVLFLLGSLALMFGIAASTFTLSHLWEADWWMWHAVRLTANVAALFFVIWEGNRSEKLLRESEQRFRATFDQAAVGIAHIGLDGRWLRVNRKLCEILGYTEQELLGLRIRGITHPDDRETSDKNLKLLLEGKLVSFSHEKRYIRKDGSTVWVLLNVSMISDPDGTHRYHVHVIQDITARKEAEEALDDRMRQASIGAEVGIALTSGNDLGIVLQQCAESITNRLDAAFARIWILNEKDNVLELQASAGMYTHLNGPHGRVPVGKYKIGQIAQGKTPLLTNCVIGDTRIHDQEWAKREGLVSFAGYPLIVADKVVGVMAMFARKPLKDTVLHALASISNEIALGIVRKKAEEALQQYRDYLEELVDKRTAQLTEANLNLLQEIADRKQAEEALVERTEELEESRSELETQNEKLKKTYSELETQAAERIRVMEELREKDQLLIQQSRMAAMGEMLGNIAHHWRQPLNVLGLKVQEIGLSHELGGFSKELLNANIAKAMEVIQQLSQTIDDFRDMTAPDKEKTLFRVDQVVAKTLSLVEVNFRENGIAIEVSTSGEPQISGYPNEYAQVLLNLLMNAKDALLEQRTKDARVIVRSWTENGRAVVTITDNAGGIGKELMDKIFDAYFTTKKLGEGTGVGLFMSKTIIENNMQGRLTVRNVEGCAEFRVEV